jgi:hypothetical protein
MVASVRTFDPAGRKTHPEPVPGASQFAVVPFIAAVAGFLHSSGVVERTRVVLHRTVNREGGEYLQQLSSYAGISYDPTQAGRMNPVTTGIMGKAYALRKIVRTGSYATADRLLADLQEDMAEVGDRRRLDEVARSYLAIPMVSDKNVVVTLLYADSFTINAFVNDARINTLLEMCRRFCQSVDELVKQPVPGIRNFELVPGTPVEDTATVYRRIQTVVEGAELPTYRQLSSFNFEAIL